MNPQWIPTWNDDFLSREVRESGTESSIKEETLRALEQAKQIRDNFSDNTEIQREYEEVRLSTIGALRNLRINTSENLDEVRRSLTGELDFTTLSEGDISAEENQNIQNQLSQLEALSEESSNSIREKSIDKLSNDELQTLLWLTQAEYGNYEEWSQLSAGWNMLAGLAEIDSYENVSDTRELHSFQERIIAKIYGEDFISTWYNWEFLHGFGTERWGNFIISIQGFNTEIQESTPENWNSLALVNYFKSLHVGGNLTLPFLLENIWAHQIVALRNLWKIENSDPNQRLAKEYFLQNKELSWLVSDTIDYSEVLESRNGFQNISTLFDAVSSEEQSEIRESIQEHFAEYIYEWKDISELEDITGSDDLSWVSEWMYRYIIEQARRTVIAQQMIDTIEVQYPDIPAVKEVFQALVLTTLWGRWVDENGELTFDLSGINSFIEEYNNGDNGRTYPLFWDEIREELLWLFSSWAMLSQFSENYDKLRWIQERTQILREEIQNIEASLARETSIFLRRRMTEDLESKRRELQRLWYLEYYTSRSIEHDISEAQNIHGTIEWNIEVKTLSDRSLEYILQSPKTRISSIESPDQLIQFYQEHWDIFNTYNIYIRDLNPLIFSDSQVVTSFPWRIERNDIEIIPSRILRDINVLERLWSDNRHVVGLSLSRAFSSWFSQQDLEQIHSFLFTKSHETENGISRYTVPTAIREYDDSLGEEERILIRGRREVGSISVSDFSTAILKLIENREENYAELMKLNLFLRQNNHSESIENELHNLLDTHPDIYQWLWSIRWNDTYIVTHQFALEKDIQNFVYMSYEQRRTREYVEILFSSTTDSNWANLHENIWLINNIPIVDWNDVMMVIRVAHEKGFENIFSQIDVNLIERFIGNTIRAFENTPSTRRIQIFNREDETQIYRAIVWYNRILEQANTLGQKVENIQSTPASEDAIETASPWINRFQNTLTYIQGLEEINAEQKEWVLEIIQNSSSAQEFTDAFTPYILSLSLSPEVQSRIISWMLWALNSDLERIRNTIITTVIPLPETRRERYNEWLWENGVWLNTQLIDERWAEFTSQLWERIHDLTNDEIKELFFTEYNIDSSDAFGRRLSEYLEIDRSQRIIQVDIRNLPEYIEAVRNGTLETYRQNIRQQYYNNELSYTPLPVAENNPSEENLVIQNTPQDIQSKDIDKTYHIISKELNLTQEESQTLTLEELEMIAGDEEIRENFIGFRSTLVELWLTELWKFRNQLFSTISESGDGFNFNLSDGDYIWENEMNIFLSKVVYATLWNDEVPELQTPPSNLEATIRIIRNINHQTGWPNDVDTVNSVWEGLTRIEYLFRERFAPRDAGLLVFARSAFSEALHN